MSRELDVQGGRGAVCESGRGSGIVMMQIGLKLRSAAADEFFMEVARRPVDSDMQIDVIPGRPAAWVYEGESVDTIWLGELLYYVLLGEGKIVDEPA